MDPWRALGPLWAQLAFQVVTQGDLFAIFWAKGAHESDFGSLFEQNGPPKASGTFL